MLTSQARIQLIEDTIDTAGYSIGYWAESAQVDTEKQTYTITPQPDVRDGNLVKQLHVITYSDFWQAMKTLMNDNPRIKEAVKSPDDADLDGFDADLIVQQAAFGKEVFS